MIKTLGTPDVTPELKQTIVEGVLREAGNRSVDELAQEENELIIGAVAFTRTGRKRDNEGNDKTSSCISKSTEEREPPMSTATITDRSVETSGESNHLTEALKEKLSHPATSPDFDLHEGVNEVLADIGMTTADSGGELTFLRTRSDSSEPDPLRDDGRNRSGRKKRSAGCALETSHRRRTGYFGGRAQGTAAFRRIL